MGSTGAGVERGEEHGSDWGGGLEVQSREQGGVKGLSKEMGGKGRDARRLYLKP